MYSVSAVCKDLTISWLFKIHKSNAIATLKYVKYICSNYNQF